MSSFSCPTEADLRRLVLGRVHPDEFENIIDHIDSCRICEQTVSKLEATLQVISPSISRRAFKDDSAEIHFLGNASQAGNESIEHMTENASVSIDSIFSDELCSGMHVGCYQIHGLIKRGGMGHVYLATHTLLDRKVALKILPAGAATDKDRISRFHREMKIAAKFAHDNIVGVFDAGFNGKWHFMSMPFLCGLDLGSLLAQRPSPLPVAEACEIIRQAAHGLQHAHEAGIIHRDVKPSNLMLTVDEHGTASVKVLDLGLARLMSDVAPSERTAPGLIMGTLDYLSPEQVFDPDAVDHRCDIYGLGATLFRLLTGRIPMHELRHLPVAKRILELAHSSPPSIGSLLPAAPVELVRLVDSMLALKPTDRPESMDEVVNHLQRFSPETPNLGMLISPFSKDPLDPSAVSEATAMESFPDAREISASTLPRPPHQSTVPWRYVFLFAAVFASGLTAIMSLLAVPSGTIELHSELDGLVIHVTRNHDPRSEQKRVAHRGLNRFRFPVGEITIQLPEETRNDWRIEQNQTLLERNGTIAATLKKGASIHNNNSQKEQVEQTSLTSMTPPAMVHAVAPELRDGYLVHPTLSRFLAGTPSTVLEFEGERVLEQSDVFLRETKDGQLILGSVPRNGVDAWPCAVFTGSGLIEIDVRIACGWGWIVVLHSNTTGLGFHISLHRRYLALGPSIFSVPLPTAAHDAPKSPSNPPLRTLTDQAPSHGIRNADRLHILVNERMVTVFLNGIQCGDPVQLNFDMDEYSVSAGIIGRKETGSTRIEYERIRKYQTH